MRTWKLKARDVQTVGIKKILESRRKPIKTQDVRQIWARNLSEQLKAI